MVSQLMTMRVFSGSADKSKPSETRNASAMPATTGMWASVRMRLGPRTATPAPRSGKNGINQAMLGKNPTPDRSSLALLFNCAVSIHGCVG